MHKIILVEGKTDKERLLAVLAENVEIICTYGTLGYQDLERLGSELEGQDVYILADADEAGNRLRRQLKKELPNAKHLYTRKIYREVATTPMEDLAAILKKAYFEVKPPWIYINEGIR